MNKKILIVDDSEIIRKVVTKYLTQRDFQVVATATTSEFFSKFKEFNPDLCIIDLNIDIINDGMLLIKAIRNKIGSDLPILVISSKAESQDIEDALYAGANDYICKPVEKSLLIAKVSGLLDSYNSEQLPIFRVPPGLNNTATLSFSLEVKRIDEAGIEFHSNHYIYLNTSLSLSGTIVTQLELEREHIKVKVISCQVDNNLEKHIIYAEFAEDDDELIGAIRNFIS